MIAGIRHIKSSEIRNELHVFVIKFYAYETVFHKVPLDLISQPKRMKIIPNPDIKVTRK